MSAGLAYTYKLHVRPSLCRTSASEVVVCDLRRYTSVICLCLYQGKVIVCNEYSKVIGSVISGLGDGSPLLESRSKALIASLGDISSPEAEAKCEITIQFLTFSSTKFMI